MIFLGCALFLWLFAGMFIYAALWDEDGHFLDFHINHVEVKNRNKKWLILFVCGPLTWLAIIASIYIPKAWQKLSNWLTN